MRYILCIDSGNSFIKWGLHDQNDWVFVGREKHETLTNLAMVWQNWPAPSVIIVSNVAGNIIQNKLTDLFAVWKTKPQWLVAARRQCGVRNLYIKPDQLGSDRWAALVAAWHIQLQASLVINIGTAMTVDALSDSGDFLGGILRSHTRIRHFEQGEFNQLPVCTDDAIFSGVIQSLAGAIERMSQMLYKRFGYPKQNCILSGGASSLVMPHLDIQAKVVDNLVLEGLLLIAKEQVRVG